MVIASLLGLYLLLLLQPMATLGGGSSDNASLPPVIYTPKSPRVEVAVSKIAEEVTVRILTNPGAGSGVIIGRRGQTYTILTNDHVVANTGGAHYKVLTRDGVTHPAQWLRARQFGNADLAVVQFSTKKIYKVAKIGNSQELSLGDPVYATGFPNWDFGNSGVKDTREWGWKAFCLTTGKVGMLPGKALPRGYQLGYTNDVENGMSGGPVLDKNGYLIGINGRLKYPFQGQSAFIFADGTTPSVELFQQMEALSWAIPIATFQQFSPQLKAQL